MKIFYYTFQYLYNNSGISNKITSQCDSLRRLGHQVDLCTLAHIDNKICYAIGDKPIVCHGGGNIGKISTYLRYSRLSRYILDNGYDLVYVRYTHNASPLYNNMLRKLHKFGVKIIMEIPTYPYDDERAKSLFLRFKGTVEKKSRRSFYKYISRIVSYNQEKEIFGIKTINISNAINTSNIRLRDIVPHDGLAFLGVAVLDFWHGYDRLINGIADYYNSRKQPEENITFYIIGPGQRFIDSFNEIAKLHNIEKHVICLGPKSSNEMDYYFSIADLAIGCLGCHRKNIIRVKSLKNVEYAMRGIPFIYSEENADFDRQPYVMRVPADESPIDIEKLISFVRQTKLAPADIRKTVEDNLSWDRQMQIVIEQINDD